MDNIKHQNVITETERFILRSSLLSDVDDGKLRYLKAVGVESGSSGQSSREHSPKGASFGRVSFVRTSSHN